MKKILLYAILAFASVAFLLSCQREAPNPAMPKIDEVNNRINTNLFTLASPAANSTVTLDKVKPNNTITIRWNRMAGTGVTYQWLATTRSNPNFGTPLLTISSNNSGRDTVLTLTNRQVDDALAGVSVAAGATANLLWTVRATVGGQATLANTPFTIDITRFGNQTVFILDVADTTFPIDADIFITGDAVGGWSEPGSDVNRRMIRDTDVPGRFYILFNNVNVSQQYKYFARQRAAGGSSWTSGPCAQASTIGWFPWYYGNANTACNDSGNRTLTAAPGSIINDTTHGFQSMGACPCRTP